RVERGLAVEPWSACGRRERGLSWLRRGRPRRAAELLEHAVRCAPHEAEIHHDLATARLAAGDRPGAKSALRRAFELYGRDRERLPASTNEAAALAEAENASG